MIQEHYAWLLWSGSLLVPWGVLVRVRELIVARTYGLGITLGSKSFRGLAEFDAAGGLLRYELSSSDGSRFVIERRDGPDPVDSPATPRDSIPGER